LSNDDPAPFPDVSNSGMEVLVLGPDGICRCYNRFGNSYEQPLPAALGSGAAVALGAMAMGASAMDAVEMAARFDTCTGGRVHYESVYDDE
jgi:hypothetical protein